LKKILIESYKTFYIGLVSVLWAAAIFFAVLQNGFLSHIVLKAALPYADITVKDVRGGVFGVLTLEGVEYKDMLKCGEISFKADVFSLLNSKKLKISLLDIKSLQFDRQKLQDELNKSDGGLQKHIDSIWIGAASIDLLEQKIDDFEFKRTKLKLTSFEYDFKRLLFEYSLDANTNVIDVKCSGHFKDFNYTAKGELKASGGALINKMADDVDFDFNALTSTPFSLHGDDKSLNARFDVQNSGVFYKYGVDARIMDVKSELFFDFSKKYMKVASDGLVGSRYGDINAKFDVVYDDKVSYRGAGVIKKFNYIPLGIFKDDIKVLSSANGSVSFEGDVHRLRVKAAKTTASGTIKGEALDVTDSDTEVTYDFDRDDLRVDVRGVASGKYGSFDFNTTVFEDAKSRVSFDGAAFIKESKNLPLKDSFLASSSVKFVGNEEKLSVNLASKAGQFALSTNDYRVYTGKMTTAQATLAEIFGLRTKLGTLSTRISAEGSYDYKRDSLKVDASLLDVKFLDKKAKFSKLSVVRTKGIYSVAPFEFELASLHAKATAQPLDDGGQVASLHANGLEAQYKVQNAKKQSTFHSKLDMGVGGVWLEELFGVKKNSVGGYADISVVSDLAAYTSAVKIESSAMSLQGYDVAPLKLSANYAKDVLSIDKLEFMHKNTHYKLDHRARFESLDGGFRAEGVSFGEKVFFDVNYKDGALKLDYRFKDFDYYDSRVAKFRLSGNGWAVLKDDKLFVNGELSTKNLEIFYSSRGAKITKDKEIKVVKPKNFLISEDWMHKNCSINLRVASDDIAKLRTREANATLVPDVIYYKDFGRKGNFVGVVKVINGTYALEGRMFKLEGGEITLIDGDEENPLLDLTLRLDETDISIYVRAKGFAASPKLTFWSKPALTEREIMSYLLFGIDDGFGFAKSNVKSDYTTKAIGALSNVLSRDIASEFGVKLDKIEVAPSEYQGKDGKLTSGTKVEIGKKITKDLTVIYKNDAESGVALQYRLNKNVGIETESRNKGSSLDLFYKQDY